MKILHALHDLKAHSNELLSGKTASSRTVRILSRHRQTARGKKKRWRNDVNFYEFIIMTRFAPSPSSYLTRPLLPHFRDFFPFPPPEKGYLGNGSLHQPPGQKSHGTTGLVSPSLSSFQGRRGDFIDGRPPGFSSRAPLGPGLFSSLLV